MAFLLGKSDEQINRLLKEPIRLSGQVWKRRGGMNKLAIGAKNAWEMRLMELRGSTLVYYNDPSTANENKEKKGNEIEKRMSAASNWLKESAKKSIRTGLSAINNNNSSKNITAGDDNSDHNASANQPRGMLDLVEEKCIVHTALGIGSGEPSPFCIAIASQKLPGVTEPRWRLCFNDHKSLMEWLAAISDVIVNSSVDEYNVQLLQAANPNNNNPLQSENFVNNAPALLRPPPVYEPGAGGSNNNTNNTNDAACHRLWMTDEYTIHSQNKIAEVQSPSSSPKVPSKEGVAKRLMEENHKQMIKILRSHHEQEIKRIKDDATSKLKAATEKIQTLEQTISSTAQEQQQSNKEADDEATAQRMAALEQSLMAKHKEETEQLQTQMESLRTTTQENIQALKEELSNQKQQQETTAKEHEIIKMEEMDALRTSLIATHQHEKETILAEKDTACKTMEETIQKLKEELVSQQNKTQQDQKQLEAIENLRSSLVANNKAEMEAKIAAEKENIRIEMEQSLKQELSQKQEQHDKEKETWKAQSDDLQSSLMAVHKEETAKILAERENLSQSMEETIHSLRNELSQKQQQQQQDNQKLKAELEQLRATLVTEHTKEKEAILAEKESLRVSMESTIQSLKDELVKKQQQPVPAEIPAEKENSSSASPSNPDENGPVVKPATTEESDDEFEDCFS